MLSVRRLLAYGTDFVLLAAILIGIQMLLYRTTGGFPFDRFASGLQIEAWVVATMSLPVWTYFIWNERRSGATIGKRLFRLKVTGEAGSGIARKQAFTRTAVKLLPWELTHLIVLVPQPWWDVDTPPHFALIYIPNALMVLYIIALLINRGERGIHDVCARTRVIDTSRA